MGTGIEDSVLSAEIESFDEALHGTDAEAAAGSGGWPKRGTRIQIEVEWILLKRAIFASKCEIVPADSATA